MYIVYWCILMENTTIKVSKATLKMLEHLRRSMNEKSIEAVIRRLLYERKQAILEEVYGIDRGRIKKFREEDRLEDRY